MFLYVWLFIQASERVYSIEVDYLYSRRNGMHVYIYVESIFKGVC